MENIPSGEINGRGLNKKILILLEVSVQHRQTALSKDKLAKIEQQRPKVLINQAVSSLSHYFPSSEPVSFKLSFNFRLVHGR